MNEPVTTPVGLAVGAPAMMPGPWTSNTDTLRPGVKPTPTKVTVVSGGPTTGSIASEGVAGAARTDAWARWEP